MTRRLVITPRARRDVRSISRWVEQRAGETIADAYVSRLQRHVEELVEFPERGTRRSRRRPHLRVIGFERRITILFVVTAAEVTVLRILYGGQNLPPDLS
jgi:toxin ParE1/3/4